VFWSQQRALSWTVERVWTQGCVVCQIQIAQPSGGPAGYRISHYSMLITGNCLSLGMTLALATTRSTPRRSRWPSSCQARRLPERLYDRDVGSPPTQSATTTDHWKSGLPCNSFFLSHQFLLTAAFTSIAYHFVFASLLSAQTVISHPRC
jgi:hypothetical protein